MLCVYVNLKDGWKIIISASDVTYLRIEIRRVMGVLDGLPSIVQRRNSRPRRTGQLARAVTPGRGLCAVKVGGGA